MEGTYPTNHPRAPTALGDHVSGALPALPIVVGPGVAHVFHVEPVPGPRPIPQRVLGIDRDFLVDAVQGVGFERAPILQQGLVDLPARAREVVE